MTARRTIAATHDMTREDWIAFERMPKTVLYQIAKHLAAMNDGDSYEMSLESGSYLNRMREEWAALYANGIVTQKPRTIAEVTP